MRIRVAAVISIAYGIGFLNNFERQTIDARFSVRGSQSAPKNIVLVLIDDITFGDLGLQWPYPRRIHAQVLACPDGCR